MVKNNCPYKTYFLEKYLEDYKIDVSKVKNIVEIGAKDCVESLKFTELFPNAHVTAFECNPELTALCEFNAGMSDRITFVDKMVSYLWFYSSGFRFMVMVLELCFVFIFLVVPSWF